MGKLELDCLHHRSLHNVHCQPTWYLAFLNRILHFPHTFQLPLFSPELLMNCGLLSTADLREAPNGGVVGPAK